MNKPLRLITVRGEGVDWTAWRSAANGNPLRRGAVGGSKVAGHAG